MRWNLRWVAANADIWRPADLHAACRAVGYSPSLGKVASWWNGPPTAVRLDELDMICAALGCRVADLLESEPPGGAESRAAAAPPDAGAPTSD
ncbi:helix-turn-helix domain-containing protein [Cryptosporangium sp. NPDC051539]|uniref:helix-turn-helix domain-containing protein n=1 Tax=Cryptosporangium sp. NPDC051539 TaxID=3363962 RepID=UPI003794A8B5